MAALERLLQHLDYLPLPLPASPSPPPSLLSLQRSVIRLIRANTAFHQAPTSTELRHRLSARLHQLAQAIDDASSEDGIAEWVSRSEVKQDVQDALRELNGNPVERNKVPAKHSRQLSASEPLRRLPSSSSTSTSTPTNPQQAALDAFLSRALSSPLSPSRSTDKAHEAARALSEAYTLFLLSSSSPSSSLFSPSAVLPPGQTLSSIFRGTSSSSSSPAPPASATEALEQRIRTQMEAAYFDSFAEVLDSSSASSEREKQAAWRRLAADVADAAGPLIPSRLRGTNGGQSKREEIVWLLRSSGGDEHSSFDPLSALEALRTTVLFLQRLCAPARDEAVSTLLASFFPPHSPSPSPSSPTTLSPASPIPFLPSLTRSTLALCAQMASDVSTFRRQMVQGLASEEDLRGVAREEGWARERSGVLALAGVGEGAEGQAQEEVNWATAEWARENSGGAVSSAVGGAGKSEGVSKDQVAFALVESLFSDVAVSLPPPLGPPFAADPSATPPPPCNVLPPILFSLSPFLFHLQNRFQALVILACLVALLPPLPPPPPSSTPSSTPHSPTASAFALDTFAARIWAILESELPPISPFPALPSASSSSSSSVDEQSAPTKLAHLADEVLSYLASQRRASSFTPASSLPAPPQIGEEEQEVTRFRTAVNRILRAQDPVYRLLKARLKEAVLASLRSSFTSPSDSTTNAPPSAPPFTTVPSSLRTGRLPRSSSSPTSSRLSHSSPSSPASPPTLPPIKGFTHPPLLRLKLEEATTQGVGEVCRWFESGWGGVLGWGEE